MPIHFHKFDGAGNDFVIVDARKGSNNNEIDARSDISELSTEVIARICHRRFGVGADGLMLLADAPEGYDFAMRYFNSDGGPADMCGNGGRCIALFAHLLGIGRKVGEEVRLRFLADDGPHTAAILRWDRETHKGWVQLSMRDVPKAGLRSLMQGHLLNTGVPHYVQQVEHLDQYDVVGEGRRLRHHPDMGPEGANIDFVELAPDGILNVRTYERGVEDETWACGTGVTACALVTGCRRLRTRGGYFEVSFRTTPTAYTDICLTGPVSYNFKGTI